jgi:DNA primase large subunit
MTKISGIDYDNTPFSIPGKMITGADEAVSVRNTFSTVNRRNLDIVVRHINDNAKKMKESIDALNKEFQWFHLDHELEVVTMEADHFPRILKLLENLNVTFENLLKATE